MASVERTTLAGSKVKKASADQKKPRASPSHPPYIEMIKEAIVALKERTGSSQYAIAKFIEEKQKLHLPSNFKKLLLVQLKKLVAAGKLVKVKNSFKLGAVPKSASAVSKNLTADKAPAKKKVAAKPKAVAKPKSASSGNVKGTPVKSKVVPKPKAKAAPKPKPKARPAKTSTVTSPGKKPAAAKVKKAPAKGVKKPKSIKSPAKKAPAKKGRK